MKLILKLRKGYFKNIIVHDDKKRSKFISKFLKYERKIIIENQNKLSHIEVIKIFSKLILLFIMTIKYFKKQDYIKYKTDYSNSFDEK